MKSSRLQHFLNDKFGIRKKQKQFTQDRDDKLIQYLKEELVKTFIVTHKVT